MRALAYRLKLVDRYGLTAGGFLLALMSGIVVGVAVLGTAIILTSRSVGRTTCANWDSATGISTKFVVLNWASAGTCLAQTPDGRWVPNSDWRAFVEASK